MAHYLEIATAAADSVFHLHVKNKIDEEEITISPKNSP